MISCTRNKLYENLVFCPSCGCFVKENKSFVKTWEHPASAICLCKKCALELAKEIKERYGVNDDE